jgi:hypothetical protein
MSWGNLRKPRRLSALRKPSAGRKRVERVEWVERVERVHVEAPDGLKPYAKLHWEFPVGVERISRKIAFLRIPRQATLTG